MAVESRIVFFVYSSVWMYVRIMPQKVNPRPIRAGMEEEYIIAASRLAMPRRSIVRPMPFEKVSVIFIVFPTLFLMCSSTLFLSSQFFTVSRY